jgi:anion-transporting  ArsA/GET3 family ATPase
LVAVLHFDRRINLITGKGGVGRTLVSVALAQAAALNGQRVLLAEVGDVEGHRSAIAPYFGLEALGDAPRSIGPGILGVRLSAMAGQEAFGRSIIPSGPLIRTALRSSALRKFMIAAPAFYELGLMYSLLTLLDAKDRDGSPLHPFIIIDMPATGHALALADLPQTVLRLVPRGPVATAMRAGQAYLNDPRITAAWIVTLPEHLPITEALELLEGLKKSAVPIGGIVLNRFLTDPFTDEERVALAGVLRKIPMHGDVLFQRIVMAREAAARVKAAVDFPVLHLPDVGAREAHEIRQVLTTQLMAAVAS